MHDDTGKPRIKRKFYYYQTMLHPDLVHHISEKAVLCMGTPEAYFDSPLTVRWWHEDDANAEE